jgi:hypothetical protein
MKIQKIMSVLELSQTNTLLIVDSCHAGAAQPQRFYKGLHRLIEGLYACRANQVIIKNPSAYGIPSFTKELTSVVNSYFASSSVLKARDLYHILDTTGLLAVRPDHVTLTSHANSNDIVIAPARIWRDSG